VGKISSQWLHSEITISTLAGGVAWPILKRFLYPGHGRGVSLDGGAVIGQELNPINLRNIATYFVMHIRSISRAAGAPKRYKNAETLKKSGLNTLKV